MTIEGIRKVMNYGSVKYVLKKIGISNKCINNVSPEWQWNKIYLAEE